MMSKVVLVIQVSNIPFTVAMLDSNNTYLFPRHLEYLQNKLLDVVHGKIKRLIVNMPPRHGKSELITHYFPSWYLMNFPDKEIRIISANDTLAQNFGKKVRDTIRNVGTHFGVTLDPASSAVNRFHIHKRKGAFSSVGIGGQITGFGADLLIIDDPIRNAEDAESLTFRDNIHEFYKSTAYTRLEPGGAIVIVMTRWHYDDLCGRILANTSEKWEILNLPGICNSDDDPLGRNIGEALWPEKFDIKRLNEIKNELGSYWFSAMYQGIPIANEDQIIKPEYWKKYNYDIINPDFVFVSWDTAIKPEEKNDFTVASLWKVKNGNLYFDDLFRKKLDFPSTLALFETIRAKHKDIELDIIEDKASGSQLIQTIKAFTNHSIKAIDPKTNKETRAHLATPLFEAGKVHIRDTHWTDIVISECAEFPVGRYDDIVDSVTQAVNYARPLLNSESESSLNEILRINPKKSFNYF